MAKPKKIPQSCKDGLHSWIHEISELPPDCECEHCGEEYGNPD